MSVGTEAPQIERTRVGSGSSVRVNLLPQATREGAKAARQKVLAAAAFGLVLAGLGGATFLQRQELSTAQEELIAADTERDVAQQEVNELQDWAALWSRLDETHATVAAALGDQSTMAGILQDLALVIPHDGSFTSVTLDFLPEVDESGRVVDSGTMSAEAETVADHSPGVERFLLQLDRAAGLRQVYPTSSAVDEEQPEVTVFTITARLGNEYQTNRYADGIPEVSR